MADILVKAGDSALREVLIDGVTYAADAYGSFAIPEESLHRVLDLKVFNLPTTLTSDQIGSLVTAGRVQAGTAVFCATLDQPLWRNAANDGWVDGVGAAVVL